MQPSKTTRTVDAPSGARSTPRPRGRPRQTHCKRGHILDGDNVRVRTHGPYFKRDCIACSRLILRENNRKRRRQERISRVMVAKGCDRATAESLIAHGLDLRRENAVVRKALVALEQRGRTAEGQFQPAQEVAA